MTRLAFAPLIPMPLLTALAVIALLITAYAFFMRARGAWARGLAFAVLLFALSGPLLVREKHAPLPDVAVIVTDSFRATTDAMASLRGAPGYQYAVTAHPVAVLAEDQVKARAAQVLDDVVALLTQPGNAGE